MSGHTPGPWRAVMDSWAVLNDGTRAVVAGDPNDHCQHIAYVSAILPRKRTTSFDAPDADRDANARLIAAAPELLEACETALAFYQRLFGVPADSMSVKHASEAKEMFAELSAAIAKAKGGAA